MSERPRWLRPALIVMAALSVFGGLGALWWWALFGLSPEIGTATVLTLIVSFCVPVGWLTFPGAFDE